MKKEHEQILSKIEAYLNQHPSQRFRFGQAILNLGINVKIKPEESKVACNTLRDIYNDSDQEILERMNNQLNWFDLQIEVNEALSTTGELEGMTVNERLHATGLMKDFDKAIKKDIENVRFILRAIKVDEPSINRILKENGY